MNSVAKSFSAARPSTTDRLRRLVPAALVAACSSAIPLLAASAQIGAPAATGILSYTAAQAARGEDAYEDNCGGCHGATLGGEGETPALAGSGFRDRWFSDTAIAFFAFISEAMPQQAPGTLEPQTYADIMAYILQRNGYPSGETELAPGREALAAMTFPARPE